MTPGMLELLEKTQGAQGFSCKYCGEVFQKGCAIGGHISKRHPDVRERKLQSKALARKRRAKNIESDSDENGVRITKKSRTIRRAREINESDK